MSFILPYGIKIITEPVLQVGWQQLDYFMAPDNLGRLRFKQHLERRVTRYRTGDHDAGFFAKHVEIRNMTVPDWEHAERALVGSVDTAEVWPIFANWVENTFPLDFARKKAVCDSIADDILADIVKVCHNYETAKSGS